MVSKGLQRSLEGVFDSQPERSNMVIQNMNNMPSVGQDENLASTVKDFLHLNDISNYVDRFLERKNADPASFAPPSKPKNSNISLQDTDMFVGKTIDFSLENWDQKQQQRLIATNFQAEVSTKEDAEFKGLTIKQERANSADNKCFLNKAHENLQNVKDALTSREAVQGAVKGFMTGGQAGAVKGYCTGAVAGLAKKKRDHDFMAKSGDSAETKRDSADSAGPKR
jgi:hypothetical protein